MTRVPLVLWFMGSVGALAFLPYLSVVLFDAGFSGPQVAATFSLLPIANLVAAPAWSWIADRTGRPDLCLKAGTALAVAGIAALLAAPHLAWIGVATYAIGRSPLSPLGDALTVYVLRGNRRSYGAIRAWGSVAFLVLAFAGGWLQDGWIGAPIALALAPMTLCAAMTWLLPRGPAVPTAATWRAFRALIGDRTLLLALGACLLHGASLTAYDSFFSFHIQGLALGGWVTGTAIAAGVGAEIVVLMSGRWVLDRLGPGWVMAIGIAAGVPRWLLTGLSSDPTVLILTQSLHGLTFGAFWVAGVALLSERAPEGLRNSAQALVPATSFGAGYLLMTITAAALLGPIGTVGLFLVMAGVSAVATLLVLGAATSDGREPRS